MTAVILPAEALFCRVYHDEQFHKVCVYGVGRGLNEKDVLAADGFVVADINFAVGKVG